MTKTSKVPYYDLPTPWSAWDALAVRGCHRHPRAVQFTESIYDQDQ